MKAHLIFPNRISYLTVSLLMYILLGMSNLYAQSTAKNVEKTAENLKQTAEALKAIKGFFGKKKQSVDSAAKVNNKPSFMDDAPVPTVSTITTKPSESIVIPQGTELDQRFIFLSVFGDAVIDDKNEVQWKPQPGEKIAIENSDPVSYDGLYHTAFDSLIYYDLDGKKYALAVWFTYAYKQNENKDETFRSMCNACEPVMGIGSFLKSPDGIWVLQDAEKLLTAHRSGDEGNDYNVAQLGKNLPALQITNSGGQQGRFEERVLYYSLSHGLQTFKSLLFNFSSKESYSGDWSGKGGYEIIRKLKTIPVAGSDFYTIQISSTKDKKALLPLIYKFSAAKGKYVLQTTKK